MAQDVLDEFVVYDLFRHKVHALNPTAATVWQWCDGTTPLAEMTDRLGTELALDRERAEPLLYLALDRLERANLLEARVALPAAYRTVRRRKVWVSMRPANSPSSSPWSRRSRPPRKVPVSRTQQAVGLH